MTDVTGAARRRAGGDQRLVWLKHQHFEMQDVASWPESLFDVLENAVPAALEK